MKSSRFIQLSGEILIEYIYTDQANPTIYNTLNYPIEILNDGYNNRKYLFSAESVSSILGNNRDKSAVSISTNNSQYVSLDINVGVPYNDYDSLLTNTADLLQSFNPNLNIPYDTIKIHFTSGFNFNDNDGIIFEILIPKRDGTLINLSSVVFNKTDTPIFNPNPFLLGTKLYSTYIEWDIPSLYFMNNSFVSSDSNLLSYKLTNGEGFLSTPTINIKGSYIYNTTLKNGYYFYDIKDIDTVSILNRDIYDLLYASVIESNNGDYFELCGKVEGSTLSNFIATLNSNGGDYIIIHQLLITEQIETTFIQTANQTFTQTSDFDEPMLFRPIIINSANAAAFIINYTLRLYNRNDNTQIIKNARLSSFDVKKYGKKLMKINLGTVPTITKVYNKIDNNGQNITLTSSTNSGKTDNQIGEGLVIQTKYVTSFRDRQNIKVSSSSVKIQNINEENGN